MGMLRLLAKRTAVGLRFLAENAKLDAHGTLSRIVANKMSVREGRALMEKIGVTKDVESVVMKLLHTVQVNTKNMNFPDFLIFVCQRRSRKQEFTIHDLFQEYEKNESKLVTADEMKSWLERHGRKLSPGQAEAIINQMRLGDEEGLTYESFLVMITARLLTILYETHCK